MASSNTCWGGVRKMLAHVQNIRCLNTWFPLVMLLGKFRRCGFARKKMSWGGAVLRSFLASLCFWLSASWLLLHNLLSPCFHGWSLLPSLHLVISSYSFGAISQNKLLLKLSFVMLLCTNTGPDRKRRESVEEDSNTCYQEPQHPPNAWNHLPGNSTSMFVLPATQEN